MTTPNRHRILINGVAVPAQKNKPSIGTILLQSPGTTTERPNDADASARAARHRSLRGSSFPTSASFQRLALKTRAFECELQLDSAFERIIIPLSRSYSTLSSVRCAARTFERNIMYVLYVHTCVTAVMQPSVFEARENRFSTA